MHLIEHILSTIAPHECLGCGREGRLLCDICASVDAALPPRCYRCRRPSPAFRTCKICRTHSPLHSVYALKPYGGFTKDLVHQLKFERTSSAAREIAELMYPGLAVASDLLVTHIPTATSRARMRGYDQAALIARGISTRLGLEYAPLLARSGQARQVGKNRKERFMQLQTSFATIRPRTMQGRHILLIDDVVTTGATLEAAAAILKGAGAMHVSAAVFAAA